MGCQYWTWFLLCLHQVSKCTGQKRSREGIWEEESLLPGWCCSYLWRWDDKKLENSLKWGIEISSTNRRLQHNLGIKPRYPGKAMVMAWVLNFSQVSRQLVLQTCCLQSQPSLYKSWAEVTQGWTRSLKTLETDVRNVTDNYQFLSQNDFELEQWMKGQW